MLIYAAFIMGLIGSMHCLGMCGPIAFALPVRTNQVWLKVFKYLMYNAGRLFVYAILGLLAGTIGKGFALAGLQQALSIATGFVIILSVCTMLPVFRWSFLQSFSTRLKSRLAALFQRYFKSTRWYSLIILGMLNGLLPCGMVYGALMGAAAAGSTISGSMFMVAFGLGTVPVMMSVSMAGSMMGTRFKQTFHTITPVLACLIGVLLIVRGLNLDIPYISPDMATGQIHRCH